MNDCVFKVGPAAPCPSGTASETGFQPCQSKLYIYSNSKQIKYRMTS